MKKIFTYLIISLLAYNSEAQITITGSSIPSINQTFGAAPSTAIASVGAYCGMPAAYDAGTNIYAVNDLSYSTTPITYWIVRRGGYWYIEGTWGGGPYYIFYRSQSTSTDPNPPCNTTWAIYTGYCYYSNSITNTGTTTSTLVLSGYCQCPVSLSTTVNPSHLQLPLLDAPSLAAISPPKKGMLTFSVDSHRPKVYDGFQWVNLIQDKGNVDLGGSLTTQGKIKIPENSTLTFGDAVYMSGAFPGMILRNVAAEGTLTRNAKLIIGADATGNVLIGQGSTFGVMAPNSSVTLAGSISSPSRIFTTNLTLDNSMHRVFYDGVGGHICTIPPAAGLQGREYYITNHGGGSLNFSLSIKTGSSTTINSSLPSVTLHIVSDGNLWRLVN